MNARSYWENKAIQSGLATNNRMANIRGAYSRGICEKIERLKDNGEYDDTPVSFRQELSSDAIFANELAKIEFRKAELILGKEQAEVSDETDFGSEFEDDYLDDEIPYYVEHYQDDLDIEPLEVEPSEDDFEIYDDFDDI